MLRLSESSFCFPGSESEPQLTPQINLPEHQNYKLLFYYLVQPIHFADDETEALRVWDTVQSLLFLLYCSLPYTLLIISFLNSMFTNSD